MSAGVVAGKRGRRTGRRVHKAQQQRNSGEGIGDGGSSSGRSTGGGAGGGAGGSAGAAKGTGIDDSYGDGAVPGTVTANFVVARPSKPKALGLAWTPSLPAPKMALEEALSSVSSNKAEQKPTTKRFEQQTGGEGGGVVSYAPGATKAKIGGFQTLASIGRWAEVDEDEEEPQWPIGGRALGEQHVEDEVVESEVHSSSMSQLLAEHPWHTLEEFRARLDSDLLRCHGVRSARAVRDENFALRAALQGTLAELKDDANFSELWNEEVDYWTGEVQRLSAEVEEQARQDAKAAAEERRLASRILEARRKLEEELKAAETDLEALRERIISKQEQKLRCESSIVEAKGRNASLKDRVTSQAALGPVGAGTAHLFVAALPALERSAVELALTCLEKQLKQLEL